MAISKPYIFEQIEPVIDFVDVEYKNPRDHTGITFVVKGDPKETIRWCRKNFGERGDGWDFTGGIKHIQLTIWSSRLITMWTMWQE